MICEDAWSNVWGAPGSGHPTWKAVLSMDDALHVLAALRQTLVVVKLSGNRVQREMPFMLMFTV